MKQAFDAYFAKTGQDLPGGPGGYFRAAYDSLICSFRYHIEQLEKMTGRELGTIHLMGGGCQSNYLTRQTAAICKRKVVSGPVEAATIGNILVQAIAKGILPDLQTARNLVRFFCISPRRLCSILVQRKGDSCGFFSVFARESSFSS